MSRLAIITARGGSKRIPRKNIKEFCGKPIIAYSIEAAIQSGLFDTVMVSTDDDEIASVAEKYGAEVPFRRSEKNSDDHAMTVDVVAEVVEEYRKRGVEYDLISCIYPTAPFITGAKLKKACEKLEKTDADALVPVVKFSFPPQRCFVLENEVVKYKWPDNEFKRSQDLEPLYHDVGQFYFIKPNVLFEEKTMVPPNAVAFVLDELEVQDIDNIEDWKIAEIKYNIMKNQKVF